ncbi:MAG: hypothetical protein ACLFQ8_03515 [Candidatus Aenigmatarchaeota archaeon]
MNDKDMEEVRLYDGPTIDCEELGPFVGENRSSIVQMRNPAVYPICTDVLEDLGIERINEERDPYKVDASASKYKVEVLYRESDEFDADEYSVEEVLFDGEIVIYEKRESENAGQFDARLEGGNIKKSLQNFDKFADNGGLKNLIFGEDLEEEEEIRRIEAIAEGFKNRRYRRHEAITRARLDGHRKGRLDEREHPGGPF